MSASRNYRSLVSIRIEQSDDGWFALSSPHVKEFFMAGKDLSKLLGGVPEVLVALYQLNYDMKVKVVPTEVGIPVRKTTVRGNWRQMPSNFFAEQMAA